MIGSAPAASTSANARRQLAPECACEGGWLVLDTD